MSKQILVLQGGLGSEREVSLKTAAAFCKALDALKLDYKVYDADENLPQYLNQNKPDLVLNALHGKYAEDGTVQGICEYLKIPYTGSGVLATALTMDKIKTKQVLAQESIPTPFFQVLNAKNKKLEAKDVHLSPPFVVKPSREGSSVGITICKEEAQVAKALEEAQKYDYKILVEKFVEGTEVTVPIVGGVALTPIEIQPKSDFYDYKHKYTKGMTDYILPPNLSETLVERLKKLAESIFAILDLRAYARIDFMVDKEGKIYFIEANPLPGCTETSLLPKSAQYDGLEFKDLILKIIELATTDYEGLR
tara:strand:- start:14791 stop:15714 length:924 start_codon:yes stop_codon:yes gene_type:complete